MNKSIIFSTLSAKYPHASPAPYCLASGVKANAPELYERVSIAEGTINEDINAFADRLIGSDPVFVGFSCYIWNIKHVLTVAKKVKEALPDTLIALGGPEVSPRARDVLGAYPFVDFVLSGEGEHSVPKLLRILEKQGKAPDCDELSSVEGLSFRKEDGTLVIKEAVRSKTKPPSPLDAGYAEALGGRIAYFESSRECPYSCAYCLSGRDAHPVFFEGDDLFDNLLKLANSSAKTVKFVDRTFNANATHADRILGFILESYGKEIPNDVTFHFEIGADILKDSTLSLLERMPQGAVQLEAGIQSFNEETLRAVRRVCDLDALEKNIKRIVGWHNMHIHIDLIAGLPCEDIHSFRKSFNRAYALGANMLQLGFLKVIHGSAIRNESEHYPCRYDSEPPYEVISTPWLSELELALLHLTEDALDRLYNSSRFKLTLEKALSSWKGTAFDFYTLAGLRMKERSIAKNCTLDEFTRFFFDFCKEELPLSENEIRDSLILDRLSSNNTGHLPDFLFDGGEELKKIKKKLSKMQSYREAKGVRRGYALINDRKTLCIADYSPDNFDPISQRYTLRLVSVAEVTAE